MTLLDMATTGSLTSAAPLASSTHVGHSDSPRWLRLQVLLVLFGGLLLRLFEAWSYFLNPDEALHSLLASHNSLKQTYAATLTTAHPPLLIVMLHYWGRLGHSELMLRLPSVVAGMAGCWLMYLWLEKITNRSAAFVGLLLMAFTPALVELSAEVRQYAILMFFMAACLYLSECALQEGSLWLIGLFSLSMCGAILTHYSALLFVLAMFVYMAARLYRSGKPILAVAWASGQLVALALAIFLLATQVSRLKQSGAVQEIAGTYLRRSIYHPGESSLLLFPMRQTLWLFTYLFSHGFLGTIALLAFIAGIVFLLRRQPPLPQAGPTARELALLLVLPFVANCLVAMGGWYPYGGTRHNSYLALLAVSGIAIGVDRLRPRQLWTRTLAVILCLAVCNVFPAPPPLIRARNHSRKSMIAAAAFLRQSAPEGSILFSDYQSGLLLGYYVCGHGVVQESPPLAPFAKAECGPYTAITTSLQKWTSTPNQLSGQVTGAAEVYRVASGTHVWLFNAGWILDSRAALQEQLLLLGCTAPHNFGDNVQVCELTIRGN